MAIEATLKISDQADRIKLTVGGRGTKESGKQTFDKAAILASIPDGDLKTHLTNLADADWPTLKRRFGLTVTLKSAGHVGVEYLPGAIEIEYRSAASPTGDAALDTGTVELEFIPER